MKQSPNNPPILSVIVLNYNAGEYLAGLCASLCRSHLTQPIEVIVVDNNSTDDSFIQVQKHGYSHPRINFIFHQNGANKGFSWGNNQGVKISHSDSPYVLFLNPDTTVEPSTIQGMINYFLEHPQIEAATCYVKLALTGQLQPECHRGFPTPWNTFWHFFGFGIPKLFPHSRLFNGYFLGHLNYALVQPIDCCVGAFFMMKRQVGEAIGWWNEKYFMYGEDLDFCYKLKQKGYHLFFVPDYTITHYQGVSSGIKKTKSAASRETKIRSALATTNAMKIFYQENLMNNYPRLLHPFISLGIKFLEIYRVFKAKYL